MSDQTTNIATPASSGSKSLLSLFRQALSSEQQDYTAGSIRRAVFLIAVPMVLEMCMESIFALVDIFFVGKLNKSEAVSTIVLTESVLTMVYSIAIGLSMAATAMVARRVGEKNLEGAAKAGMQTIVLAVMITIVISIAGLIFGPQILQVMGASQETVAIGSGYTRIIYGGSIVIMLLFIINGVFRGAGDPSLALRSLIIANVCNIILCPILVYYGLGPIPAMGVTGAAIATTIGRGIGVLYQLYHLIGGKRIIKMSRKYLTPDWSIITSIFNVAWTGTAQFLIGSASWMVLVRIMAEFGDNAVAGYGVAVRLMMFFLLPAWGMSNAAAALVGQNLGAQMPDRAEKSVWTTAKYNVIFMAIVTVIFVAFPAPLVQFMNDDATVDAYAVQALHIVGMGYIFYGVGMVVTNAFNGAGDTKTPTLINIFGFWLFQIPLAYLLAITFKFGPTGVFLALIISEAAITVAGVIIFRKGNWKKVKI